ncbi:MAG: MMPL family transporter, partial [Methylococcales bacterium]
PPRKGLLEYWMDFCQRYRGKMIILLLPVLGLASANLPAIRWIQDLQELTPEIEYLKKTDRAIRERTVSIEPGRFVLISASNPEKALQKAERLYPLLDELKLRGQLREYFGLYPWLLSKRQQQINADFLREHLNEKTLSAWHSALNKQGLSVERLGKLDYATAEPLTPDQVLASPLRHLIDSQIAINPGKVLITIWLGKHDVDALQAKLAGIEGVTYFSQRDLLNRLTVAYTERASLLAAAGIALVFTLLWIGYRRPWPALQTLLPSLSATLLIAGAWPLTGQALSFLHLCGFLLAISICDDFGIFFRENRGGEIGLTYRAMAASMLTTVLAFACLAVARTSMLRTLSLVVGLGVLIGFLLCPVFIKASDRHHA